MSSIVVLGRTELAIAPKTPIHQAAALQGAEASPAQHRHPLQLQLLLLLLSRKRVPFLTLG